MAWVKELGACIRCGRPATCEVMNSRNSSMGTYCKLHGHDRAKELTQQEQAEGGAK